MESSSSKDFDYQVSPASHLLIRNLPLISSLIEGFVVFLLLGFFFLSCRLAYGSYNLEKKVLQVLRDSSGVRFDEEIGTANRVQREDERNADGDNFISQHGEIAEEPLRNEVEIEMAVFSMENQEEAKRPNEADTEVEDIQSSTDVSVLEQTNLKNIRPRGKGNVTVSCLNLYYYVARKTNLTSSSIRTRVEHQESKSKPLLSNISAVFPPASLTAFMGPSGSGKTSLLNILSGNMRVGKFSGLRLLDGVHMDNYRYDAFMQTQGYVSQFDALSSDLTVWETVFFSALLRLPKEFSLTERVLRAQKVLCDVGLSDIADKKVGSIKNLDTKWNYKNNFQSSSGLLQAFIPENSRNSNRSNTIDDSEGEGKGGISGGQRRKLSIALELIHLPSILMLDEPTSGLDASSSLSIVSLLYNLTRNHDTTIMTTIHQPRPEIFNLFDKLLLLSNGKLVYLGNASKTVSFLEKCSALASSTEFMRKDNPGDFIIDCLGGKLRTRVFQNQNCSTLQHQGNSNTLRRSRRYRRDNEQHVSNIRIQDDDDTALLLTSSTRNSYISNGTHRSIDQLVEEENSQDTNFLQDCMDEDNSMILVNHYITSNQRKTNIKAIQKEIIYAKNSAQLAPIPPSIPYCNFWTQVEILYHRKCKTDRFTLSSWKHLWQWVYFLVVEGLIILAFSYPIRSIIEKSYQAYFLIVLTVAYGMILQYLNLVTIYVREQSSIMKDRMNGSISFAAYILTSIVLDSREAIFHSTVLLLEVYLFHPLNPDIRKIFFAYLCFIIGTCAFQAIIALCSIIADDVERANSILFMIFGGGTLFGGIFIGYMKIPIFLRWIYYISIPAITQRALLVNDLQCCYMSVECKDIWSNIINGAINDPSSTFANKNEIERGLTDVYLSSKPFLNLNDATEFSDVLCPFLENQISYPNHVPTTSTSMTLNTEIHPSRNPVDESASMIPTTNFSYGQVTLWLLEMKMEDEYFDILLLIVFLILGRLFCLFFLGYKLKNMNTLTEVDEEDSEETYRKFLSIQNKRQRSLETDVEEEEKTL